MDRSTIGVVQARTAAWDGAGDSPRVGLGTLDVLRPEAQQNRDGFGDASLPRDPVPHRAGRDPEPRRGGDLAQAEALEHGAQLPGSHRHAGIKIGTQCRRLADRHIMPIFDWWLFLGPELSGNRSAPRFDCWWRSRTTFARGGSPCRRGTLMSTPGDAGLGPAPWGASCSRVWAQSLAAPHGCSASPGGSRGDFYGSSTCCARSEALQGKVVDWKDSRSGVTVRLAGR